MNNIYYGQMRNLALEKRNYYNLSTSDIKLSSIREIYRSEGINIDPTRHRFSKLKAAYFCDECGCHVLLNMNIPEEPRLFAMVHELKHHFVDQDKIRLLCYDVTRKSPIIEIGAEVFAAEFILPQQEFIDLVEQFDLSNGVTEQDVVNMKISCGAKVSYTVITKYLTRLGYISLGQFKGVQFTKIHEQMYGSRYYRGR